MKLDPYMRENAISDAAMAAKIGNASVSGVRKWRSGERLPRKDQLRRIAEITDGAVMPNDFVMVGSADAASRVEAAE